MALSTAAIRAIAVRRAIAKRAQQGPVTTGMRRERAIATKKAFAKSRQRPTLNDMCVAAAGFEQHAAH